MAKIFFPLFLLSFLSCAIIIKESTDKTPCLKFNTFIGKWTLKDTEISCHPKGLNGIDEITIEDNYYSRVTRYLHAKNDSESTYIELIETGAWCSNSKTITLYGLQLINIIRYNSENLIDSTINMSKYEHRVVNLFEFISKDSLKRVESGSICSEGRFNSVYFIKNKIDL